MCTIVNSDESNRPKVLTLSRDTKYRYYKMVERQGLTGIDETARGFVVKHPGPVYNKTLGGRPRITFVIACGITNIERGKYATRRYCIAYGNEAEKLKGMKPGNLVKVFGWISTEAELDEFYKPKVDNEGRTITREHMIIKRGELLEYQKGQGEYQPALLTNS